jgi:hypothetical protein
MTDATMRAKLAKLPHVRTVTLGVLNEVLRVEESRVWVRSERTGNDRPISFNEIRSWSKGRRNSRVRLALAVALGLTQGSA